jgi:hypothetical protein
MVPRPGRRADGAAPAPQSLPASESGRLRERDRIAQPRAPATENARFSRLVSLRRRSASVDDADSYGCITSRIGQR